MKSILLAIAILFSVSVFGQDTTKPKTEKTFVITGTTSSFQSLIGALDNPDDFSKNQIKAIKEWIIVQLNKQLAAKEQPKK